MRSTWTIRRDCTCGCKCPTVYVCGACQTKYPAAPKNQGPLGGLRCRVCEERREALQRLQREAGERYWGDLWPAIETWEMAMPGDDD